MDLVAHFRQPAALVRLVQHQARLATLRGEALLPGRARGVGTCEAREEGLITHVGHGAGRGGLGGGVGEGGGGGGGVGGGEGGAASASEWALERGGCQWGAGGRRAGKMRQQGGTEWGWVDRGRCEQGGGGSPRRRESRRGASGVRDLIIATARWRIKGSHHHLLRRRRHRPHVFERPPFPSPNRPHLRRPEEKHREENERGAVNEGHAG